MTRTRLAFVALALAFAPLSAAAEEVAVSLSGSRASMLRQNEIAKAEDYSFLRTPVQVRRFVDDGRLVPVHGNGNFRLANVSYPFERPVVQAFVERLAEQYRGSCGEQLVVTSLTRPTAKQPRNASPLSVHPAGMAADLRVSQRSSCRTWLTKHLLGLEEQGLIDVTLERSPPHYHIAVFPGAYADYEHNVRTDSANVATSVQAQIAAREAELAAQIAAEPVTVAVDEKAELPLLVRVAALLAQLVMPIMV